MPTYQYRCRDCTTEFEIRQSFSDDPITVCPTDGCPGLLRKVFSGVGISFKGDGFYKNDHGSSAAKRRSEVSTASSGGSDASTSGGSDTSGTSGDKGGGADKASTSNGSGGGADNKPAPTKAPATSGT
jgi:putative FmdB family regulatory protein